MIAGFWIAIEDEREMVARCCRCGGKMTSEQQEEPRCYMCGWRDYSLTDSSREIYWGVMKASNNKIKEENEDVRN